MAILTRADILTFLNKAATVTEHEDGLLTMLRPKVEQAVKRFVGYSIERATHTLYLPEDGRQVEADPFITDYDAIGNKVYATAVGGQHEHRYLMLPELPVRSVTSIYEDSGAHGGQGSGDFAEETLLTAGEDYWVDYQTLPAGAVDGLCKSGKIERIGVYWPARPRTVKITFTAGYSQDELSTGIASDIKLACLTAIQFYFARQGSAQGQIQSERLGDYSVTYAHAISQGEMELPKSCKKILRPFVRYSRFM